MRSVWTKKMKVRMPLHGSHARPAVSAMSLHSVDRERFLHVSALHAMSVLVVGIILTVQPVQCLADQPQAPGYGDTKHAHPCIQAGSVGQAAATHQRLSIISVVVDAS